MSEPINASLINHRIIVWQPEKGSELYKEAYYGKPLGIRKPKSFDFNRPLELSLIEALYLVEKGRIALNDTVTNELISFNALKKKGEQSHRKFDDKYFIYKDLRERGYIVRPGLKFGADFAVYVQGPGIDHSPFIVHVIPRDEKISAIEMVRAGRLATSVRKRFIIATINPSGTPGYFIFNWFRP